MLEVLDGRDFDLDGGPHNGQTSRYVRELPEHWCFDGRAFGGYTSALALAAVFAHSGRRAAASLSVTFVEGGVPGPLELEARTIRGGRAAEAVEATITQAGRTILIASSWLADGWLGPPSVDAPIPFERYGTATSPLPDPGRRRLAGLAPRGVAPAAVRPSPRRRLSRQLGSIPPGPARGRALGDG